MTCGKFLLNLRQVGFLWGGLFVAYDKSWYFFKSPCNGYIYTRKKYLQINNLHCYFSKRSKRTCTYKTMNKQLKIRCTYHKSCRCMKRNLWPERVFSWCNVVSDRLRNRSKRVRTPVVLLHSLSGKYPAEKYEFLYATSVWLNSTTTVFLEGWPWH